MTRPPHRVPPPPAGAAAPPSPPPGAGARTAPGAGCPGTATPTARAERIRTAPEETYP